MKLAITIAATESYCYAMRTLARRVTANLLAADWSGPGVAIIAGDSSREVKDTAKAWKQILPENWTVEHLDAAAEDHSAPNYKPTAQLILARLRGAAFSAARRAGADLCWSLDSDTLPPANALRCMVDMLHFDKGYYSVSTCPYPNEAFLGGRGSLQHPIAENVLESERILTDELKAEKAELERIAKETDPSKPTEPTAEWLERRKKYEENVRKCPEAGNVFALNAKGWRQRGWFEMAYPGIGKGSVVPSDWCGFGCTLMNREALALANFEGYDGQGTEDLYVVWKRWWPAGLRINCIPHAPCDHVIWQKKKGGDEKVYTLIQSLHETQGECIGHLRTTKHTWTEL